VSAKRQDAAMQGEPGDALKEVLARDVDRDAVRQGRQQALQPGRTLFGEQHGQRLVP
jgi:hypothetical protein